MRDEDWNEQTDDDFSESTAMLVIGPSGYYAAA